MILVTSLSLGHYPICFAENVTNLSAKPWPGCLKAKTRQDFSDNETQLSLFRTANRVRQEFSIHGLEFGVMSR